VTYQIRDDEIVMPDDPRGEAKIDLDGNLLGGAFPPFLSGDSTPKTY
jgi:hypothetical protein